MKKTLIAAALVCAGSVMAEEINSDVIHNYKFVGVGYGFLNNVIGSTDAHGGYVDASYDFNNVLVGVGADYFHTAGSPDLNLWGVDGSVGYAIRLMENHVNIIPHFGVGYSAVSGSRISDNDTTSILPGVTLSYAFNNTISINGGYTYAYDVDHSNHANTFSAGTVIAIAKNVGLNLSAGFDDKNGFDSASAGVTFHF